VVRPAYQRKLKALTPRRLHPRSFAALLWLTLLCGCLLAALPASALQLDAEAQAYLDSRPRITIGVIADNEPYSWVEGGRVSGFSIDVLEEIASRTGLRFDYRAGSWPEIYPAFLRGEIDAIDEISFREERAPLMLFTEPYHFRQTVIVHDASRPLPPLHSLDDLKPFRVGIVRDIYYKSAFTERDIAVTEYDGLPNLVRALAFGWVDAIAGPEVTLTFLARQGGFSHLGVAGSVSMGGLEVEDFRIGVLRGREPLHRILAAGLADIPPQRLREMVQLWQEFGGKSKLTPGFRLSEQQAGYIRRLGPVRVGIMRDYAPFSFLDGGKVQGLSVDVLSRVQDLTGLQVITVSDRWPVLFDLFSRGEIDIIANISDSPARRDFTRFTEPYYVIPNVVFTRNGALQVNTADDLRGQRIALGSGVFYEAAVRALYGDSTVAFSSQESMFRALAEGSVDVVLAALPNGNHWVRELGLTDIRIAGELRLDGIAGEDLRFGVRPALEPLAHIIDQALAAISPTERRTIENRWMGAAGSGNQADPATRRISLNESERAYLAAREGRVRICIDPDWMPLEGADKNGRHIGFSADVLALFETRAELRFETVPTATWPQSMEAARARRCDLLPMVMQTPERVSHFHFTTPYYTVPNVLLARVEAPYIDTLDELSGRQIGVVRGYAFVELLRIRHPGLRIVEVDNEIDGLRRLQRGEIYGYVSTLTSASYHLQELGLADIKVIGRVPGDWALAIATRNDEPQLHAIAQKLVDSLTDEDRRQLEDKWRTVRLQQPIDYTLIWQLAAGAALVLALLFLWNRKLGALNRQLAEANSQLARLSVTDSLTGVGNREYFEQEFDKGFRRCQRHKLGFVVAMLDIDHFKDINDTYGHQAGDNCLAALGQCLQAHARRESDHVARFGGEEFAIFSTANDIQDAYTRFEALRTAVQALVVPWGAGTLQFTVSIGVAMSTPAPDDQADALLTRADHALYEAKRRGRNLVVVAGEESA
jgi:polar amino acid transport system substrate-binding protein